MSVETTTITAIGVKKHILYVVLTAVLTALVTATLMFIPFYFNTNNSVNELQEKSNKFDDRIEKMEGEVENSIIEPKITTERVNSLERNIETIQDDLKQTNQKLDKMFEIMIEIKNK